MFFIHKPGRPSLLFRALHHLADSGFEPEADSAFALCRATNWFEPLACGTRHLDFRFARSRLEYSVKVDSVQRVGWLMDRGGVEARVWEGGRAKPRWKLALFDAPPALGERMSFGVSRTHWPEWPAPAAWALARDMLVRKAGGAPHEGFVAPQMASDAGFGPLIAGPLATWRAANPGALVANVSGRRDLTDEDFVHLAGIMALDMSGCTNPGLTDAAFAHLRGAHTVDMGACSQASITDAAFAHLQGLRTLKLYHCSQPTITDGAFAHLRGIQVLSIGGCDQATITRAALAHLRGVRFLRVYGCSPGVVAAAHALRLPVV